MYPKIQVTTTYMKNTYTVRSTQTHERTHSGKESLCEVREKQSNASSRTAFRLNAHLPRIALNRHLERI